MANPRIEELKRRLEKEPGSRLFAQLAEELRKDGQLAEAIQVCREGLQRHALYPSARMTLGRALFDSGELGGARAEFEQVLKAAPDNILASRFLAECLEGLGDLEGARVRYRATLTLAPSDKQVVARLEALEARVRGSGGGGAAAALETLVPGRRAPVAATPPGVEPPPIPLVEAEESFELERPFEAPAPSGSPATRSMTTPSAPATVEPVEQVPVVEFSFEAEPPAAVEAEPGLASPTLGELYFEQGLPERAVEVYRQILDREPGNERARARLAELEAVVNRPADRTASTPDASAEARAARRRLVEQTIERLEGLLASVRRG